jgi:transcriptional regulator with XRE-family HTH domain
MTAHKLTDREVAKRIPGLSYSQVCRIRRGKNIPSVATAKKLSELTKIPPEVFIFGERK